MESSCPRCGDPIRPVEGEPGAEVRCARCGQDPAAAGAPAAEAGTPRAAPAAPGALPGGKPSPWSIAGIRRRLSAAKLRWEFGSLRRSLRSQLEGLGAAAARTPPAGIDLAGDLEDLARLEREAAEKEAAIESLKKSPGSGAAVREARAALDAVRRRAGQARASIGRKVEAARPPIPGVSYAGVDFAKAGLELKAEALGALGEAVPEEGARRPVPVLPLLAVAGGILAVILLAGLLRGSPGGIPAWAIGYVPDGTKVLAYADLDRIRDSGIFRAFYGKLAAEGGLEKNAGIRLAEGDVSALFLAGIKAGPAVIVRTTRDRSLEDLLVGGGVLEGGEAAENLAGENKAGGEGAAGPKGGSAPFEVRRFKGGIAAKTGARTFCFGDSREYLLQAARGGTGPARDLSPGLREAGAGVTGDVIVVIGDVAEEDPFLPTSEGMIRLGLGLRVGSTVTLSGRLGFKTDAAAGAFLARFEGLFIEAEQRISSIPEAARETMRKDLATTRALRLRQAGDALVVEGSWPQEEAARFLSRILQSGPGALFRGF